MRVLVVEDQVDLGDVFRDFLVELGHHPLVVHTAEAALAKLRTEPLDAILLDVQLPGMSGVDFLQLRPVRALGVPSSLNSSLRFCSAGKKPGVSEFTRTPLVAHSRARK